MLTLSDLIYCQCLIFILVVASRFHLSFVHLTWKRIAFVKCIPSLSLSLSSLQPCMPAPSLSLLQLWYVSSNIFWEHFLDMLNIFSVELALKLDDLLTQ